MKKISITTACYNEKENIEELYERITAVMKAVPEYEYELVFIDNCSVDGTRDEIRRICAADKRIKAIFNVRNFGHIRSPWHGFLQTDGDATIAMCSDLEDPPELIPEMIKKWEQGYKLALAKRKTTAEGGLTPYIRNLFYWGLDKISNVRQPSGVTGFGLYDKEVVDTLRRLNDPYPYARGLLCELGWKYAEIPFDKPRRKHGQSKGSFFVYLDLALLAVVNHSRIPLRLATLTGIFVSALSFLSGLYYLAQKLLNWSQFQAGVAPGLIAVFFLFGIMLLFLGLIGEYVGLLVTHVVRRPLVVEEERINFNAPNPAAPAPPTGHCCDSNN